MAMKLRVSVEGKTDIERFILLLNVGLTTALREGIISIEQAENFLYNPYSIEKLNKIGISECITELVHLGCELEDVESLLPHKLEGSIEAIKRQSIEQLRSIPPDTIYTKKWIDE